MASDMERRDDALDVRASDAERERMVARLREHMADGRLSVDEFSDRASEAYAAKTVRDLELCLRDLPREGLARADVDTDARREWRRDAVARFAFPNLTCIGVWALSTGGHGYFWPGWVLLVTGIGLSKKLLHGPHQDSPELPTASTAGLPTTTGPARNDGDHDERVLTTCLFVDVVGSTELAASLGDARWSDVLDQHHRQAHDRVTKWRGQEIFTKGDELVAGFDSASRAVFCARDIRDTAHSLGLEIRAGLHAGEVQRRGADVSGIALHIGQRVSGLAGAGEILVSSTVKDMATGSGIEFEARGESQLKGVPGNWLLFAVTD